MISLQAFDKDKNLFYVPYIYDVDVLINYFKSKGIVFENLRFYTYYSLEETADFLEKHLEGATFTVLEDLLSVYVHVNSNHKKSFVIKCAHKRKSLPTHDTKGYKSSKNQHKNWRRLCRKEDKKYGFCASRRILRENLSDDLEY